MPTTATKVRPAGVPADPALVAGELARLAALDLGTLRVAYRNRTGRIAPARLSRALLFRVLAYRVQVDAHGDLAPETRRLLDRLASSAPGDAAAGSTPVPVPDLPRPGTVLVREWRGRGERVTVVDGGFAWNGARYASLSAVALAITGTKWNGRRFFGLDRPGSGPARLGRDRGAAPTPIGDGPMPKRRGSMRPPAGTAP